MRKSILVLLLILTTFIAVGCSKQPAVNSIDDESLITVTDMAGREVAIEGPIERILFDQWGCAEIVFAVVGEEALGKTVAVGNNKTSEFMKSLYADKYSGKYTQLKSLPNIGGGGGGPFDVEAIIALKPDVFIINSTDPGGIAEMVGTLEKAGIPSIILNLAARPMETPQIGIELIGNIFGKEERAQELNNFINTQFELINSKNLSERTDKPTVYMEKGSGSADKYDSTWASGSWSDIIEYAGGINIAANTSGSSAQIDPEYLITSDPDFIIIAGALGFGEDIYKGTAVLDEYAKRVGWDKLKAVRENNYYELPHGYERNQMTFYPSLFLAKLFYPAEFADTNPPEILKEYFDRYMLLDYDEGVWFVQRKDF